ncbi:hypothetical protein APD36_10980 [Acinetobacter pittii]|uniref:hypothetical protein n=1 Tax=Acinetobacter pittii TaxID=48296 RepID=UPI0007078FC9|nr:hypothetical protein [Acinetobacter pittii]KQE17694.1 hypothetical protein APD36_10980 [Acinetobacter pittii]OTL80110.1 hypothetical protein B9X62_20130 [Acinetobacter pittii]
MNDPLTLKSLPWVLKIWAAVMGGILALMLSGDINTEGMLKINRSVALKLFISITISLCGGSAFIEYFELSHYSHMAQGFVMLIFAVFGMLLIGIWYQAIQLWKGKTMGELIFEIKETFKAIFK